MKAAWPGAVDVVCEHIPERSLRHETMRLDTTPTPPTVRVHVSKAHLTACAEGPLEGSQHRRMHGPGLGYEMRPGRRADEQPLPEAAQLSATLGWQAREHTTHRPLGARRPWQAFHTPGDREG